VIERRSSIANGRTANGISVRFAKSGFSRVIMSASGTKS
jgi:hypothetical protein